MADTGANDIVQRHDIQDPGRKLLDELAAQYRCIRCMPRITGEARSAPI